jgi:hypothetical protein
LAIPEARAWILDNRITWNHIGVGMVSDLRAWMDELPGQTLAEFFAVEKMDYGTSFLKELKPEAA